MIGTAFSLYVDASYVWVGAVSLQADGGVEHPVKNLLEVRVHFFNFLIKSVQNFNVLLLMPGI